MFKIYCTLITESQKNINVKVKCNFYELFIVHFNYGE